MHPNSLGAAIFSLRVQKQTAIPCIFQPGFVGQLSPLEFQHNLIIFIFFIGHDTPPLFAGDPYHTILYREYIFWINITTPVLEKGVPALKTLAIE